MYCRNAFEKAGSNESNKGGYYCKVHIDQDVLKNFKGCYKMQLCGFGAWIFAYLLIRCFLTNLSINFSLFNFEALLIKKFRIKT